MVIKFFNTLTRKKEEFIPINKKEVRMYTCGPTVYDFAHIGNFRTYVWQDVLKRWLIYRGFNVKHVMNLTDVDDKTIRGARKEGVELPEFTQKYTDAFFEDMNSLNIIPADLFTKATEYISEMVNMIKKLIENGFAYKADDGSIYFDISEFPNYGELSKLKLEELKPGARVKADTYEKNQAEDFALWKAWDKEDGEVFWETEIGKGRPGWHIECSVMSVNNLGENFDIHTGGIDLMFPHHENEIAQSTGSTGRKFVNYWLHAEHLLVDGRKMSKSLGNFFTLRDVLDRGYDPKTVRYLLLSSHYRQQLNFTFAELDAATKTVKNIFGFVQRLEEIKNGESNKSLKKILEKTKKDFENAMDDDLNTNLALAAMFGLIKEVNKMIDKNKFGASDAKSVLNFMEIADESLLGLDLLKVKKEKLPEEAEELIKKREQARKKKDFETADIIRRELEKKFGIVLEDTDKGVKWKKKN